MSLGFRREFQVVAMRAVFFSVILLVLVPGNSDHSLPLPFELHQARPGGAEAVKSSLEALRASIERPPVGLWGGSWIVRLYIFGIAFTQLARDSAIAEARKMKGAFGRFGIPEDDDDDDDDDYYYYYYYYYYYLPTYLPTYLPSFLPSFLPTSYLPNHSLLTTTYSYSYSYSVSQPFSIWVVPLVTYTGRWNHWPWCYVSEN